MNKIKVGIIDYGAGNIFSIINMLRKLSVETIMIYDYTNLSEISHLIVPGVGSFDKAMFKLKTKKLDKFIFDFINSGKPFLGICLGMQILFSSSEEGGKHNGTNIIDGKVVSLNVDINDKSTHVQWNKVKLVKEINKNEILKTESYFYFAHRYAIYDFAPNKLTNFGLTFYGQKPILAYGHLNNIFFTQFHPEKSGINGIKFLKNFLEQIK